MNMKTKFALSFAVGAALVAVPLAAQQSRVAKNTGRLASDSRDPIEERNNDVDDRDQRGASSPGVIANCMVSAIEGPQVPAQEAGVLIEIKAIEGQVVREGDLLAQIEDSQPRMQGRVAQAEHRAAQEKAESMVDIKYAEKASQVALKEWEKGKEANNRSKGSVTEVELERQRLTYERGILEIERAKSEKVIAGLTADAKKVEVEAAVVALERRQITSPVDGMVVQVHLHKGEWVKPGDPVVHVVQLDRLKVEGYIEFAKQSPSQLMGKPVTIEATLQGRKVQFNGQITFVSPLIEGTLRRGTYRVKAEVENREENNDWLLKPGLFVEMRVKNG